MTILSLFKGDVRGFIIARNAGASIALKGVNVIIQLILIPLTLSALSAELYGVWLTISSLVLWLGLFDFGFESGLKNRLTESVAESDLLRGRKLVTTTYVSLGLIVIPVVLAGMLILPRLDYCDWLNIDLSYKGEVGTAMVILIVAFGARVFLAPIESVIGAYQQVALSSVLVVCGNFLSLAGVWMLVRFGQPSFVRMTAIMSLAPVLVMLAGSVICYLTRYRRIAPRLKYISFGCVRDLLSLGLKFFIVRLQGLVFTQVTPVLLAAVSGPMLVAQYGLSLRYLGTVQVILALLMYAVWPAFTDAFKRGEIDWMKEWAVRLQKVAIAGVLFVGVGCMIAPHIYGLWLGIPDIVSDEMTLWVGALVVAMCYNTLFGMMLNGIGAMGLQTCLAAGALLCFYPVAHVMCEILEGYGIICTLIILNFVMAFVMGVQVWMILRRKAVGIWLR